VSEGLGGAAVWQTGSGKTYTMSGHEEILDRENYQVRVRCDR
jgi:hypothetical protein